MKEGKDMKINIIKISIIIVSVFVVSLLSSITNYKVEAATDFDPTPYTEKIYSNQTTGTSDITEIGRILIGVLKGAGTVVSVIALIAIGIKYMTGSVEEKAQYKQTMLPYVIGAIMVFAITTLLPIIVEVASAI